MPWETPPLMPFLCPQHVWPPQPARGGWVSCELTVLANCSPARPLSQISILSPPLPGPDLPLENVTESDRAGQGWGGVAGRQLCLRAPHAHCFPPA